MFVSVQYNSSELNERFFLSILLVFCFCVFYPADVVCVWIA